tara:strand:- start:777 stop:992 length:216 start_codon:yes stop_codon:yes gene_type:complete
MANRYRMVDDKLVQLTDAEEKNRKAEEELNAKEIANRKKEEDVQATKKSSAITKLKDLGLTDDEITALIGG